jgi:hypothetical protein
MRALLARLGLPLVAVIALAVACSKSSSDDATNAAGQGGGNGAGGAQGAGAGPLGGASPTGIPSGCHGDPDGFCDALGKSPETCACPDCVATAHCKGGCHDDGECKLATDGGPGTEDCSCADCWGKIAACPPGSVGCTDDPECTIKDDCTCPKCRDTDRCKGHCTDNGSCVAYLESCDCKDCKSTDACGAKPPPPDAGGSGGGAPQGGSGQAGAAQGGASQGGAAQGGAPQGGAGGA